MTTKLAGGKLISIILSSFMATYILMKGLNNGFFGRAEFILYLILSGVILGVIHAFVFPSDAPKPRGSK